MNVDRDSDLARIREVRIRISEDFHDDPELLVRHYMEIQERHHDRLVHSTDTKDIEAKFLKTDAADAETDDGG